MRCAEDQSPTKDAVFYWTLVNRSMMSQSDYLRSLWKEEKAATLEVLRHAKQEGLAAIDAERDRILHMSREAAVAELIRFRKLDGRAGTIKAVEDNGLFLIK